MTITCMRRRSARTAARSSPPARTIPPGCGTPKAEGSCDGSRTRMRCGRLRSAPTAAPSSPPAMTMTARLWDAASGKELRRLTHEGRGDRRRRSAPTAAPSSPPAWTGPPGCGTPPAARSCIGSCMTAGCGRRRSAPTAAPSSPPATTRPPGCGTPPAARSCNGSRMTVWCGAASFSPDGRTVLTASLDKTARLWDAESGKELHRLTHEGRVWCGVVQPRRPHRRHRRRRQDRPAVGRRQRQGAATAHA